MTLALKSLSYEGSTALKSLPPFTKHVYQQSTINSKWLFEKKRKQTKTLAELDLKLNKLNTYKVNKWRIVRGKMRCWRRMLSHVISIPFTALHSTHAALDLKLPQSPLLLCHRNILFLVNSYPLKCRKCPFSCTVSCSWFFTNREKLHFKRFLLVLLIVPVSYF